MRDDLSPPKGIINGLVISAVIAVVASAVLSTCARAQVVSDSAAQAIAIAGGGTTSAPRTQRIVTVPGVIPPSFYGANPCSNSASGGGAGVGFGISIGGQWTERECRDQEWFRFLNMAGDAEVARAYICARYEDIRAAYLAAGRPCPQDAARPVSSVAPPAMVVAPQALVPSVAAPVAATTRPDWCATASPSERRRYPACNS